MKKYLAELIGTFALTLIVILSISRIFPISTVLLAGLTVGIFVYSIGEISGSHLNPAVTLGALSIGKIKVSNAVGYIIAQFLGAFVAVMLSRGILGITSLPISVVSNWYVGVAELIGAFFFTFGIASVIFENTPKIMSGIVIGGSLILGIAFAVTLGSNGVLNPAVAFGIKSVNLMYMISPIVGSILGMNIYKFLS